MTAHGRFPPTSLRAELSARAQISAAGVPAQIAKTLLTSIKSFADKYLLMTKDKATLAAGLPPAR